MRLKLLALAAGLSLLTTGCAGGIRLGGNDCGIGVGGYIGPVPDVIKPDRAYYPPPEPPQ